MCTQIILFDIDESFSTNNLFENDSDGDDSYKDPYYAPFQT